MQNKPTSPGAADSAWTTPDVPKTSPVVSAIVPTNERPETPDPIVSPWGQDAIADDVSSSVAGAVANAQARYHSHELDTHPQGSQIGAPADVTGLTVSESSKHTGGEGAAGFQS